LEEADEALLIGPAPALASYLNQEAILKVIRQTGADGVHPGYGFLSENAVFAEAVETLGVRFIGPSPRLIAAMAHKQEARNRMAAYGVPVGPGSRVLDADPGGIADEARRIGYPVLVKPAGGGGGIGMQPVYREDELMKAVERSRSLALRSFASDEVYLEKYMIEPRHIELQVLADRHGQIRLLFERDCSIQRRHQKIIEEAPAPGLPSDEIDRLGQIVVHALRCIGYDNIGTVEMLRSRDGSYHFLEMNTRLQVEHAVTELITGIDLVIAQIRSAAGERLESILPEALTRSGHAIEARIYAEDPVSFFPSPGKLSTFRPPVGHGIRVETGYREGMEVTPYYDPMIAKVIAHAGHRDAAIDKLLEALRQFDISGLKTNLPFLKKALDSAAFRAGNVHTGFTKELTG
jgi:acetyl-CoA carboxylase biotin carboxylase subunit